MDYCVNNHFQYRNEEVPVVAALNGLYNVRHKHCLVNIDLICYELTGKFINQRTSGHDRTICKNVRKAMETLEKDNKIDVLQRHGDNYIIGSKNIYVASNFTRIHDWELRRIFENSKTPFGLSSFFVRLVSTINSKSKEWHMSQDKMVELWNIGKDTVQTYLKQLESLELIYVHRPNRRHEVNGQYRSLCNSYGRFADKELIIEASKAYLSSVKSEEIKQGFDRRSIKQRYNAFLRGAAKYQDVQEKIALYHQCNCYNEYIKELAQSRGGEPAGLLDLSYFQMEDMDDLFIT